MGRPRREISWTALLAVTATLAFAPAAAADTLYTGETEKGVTVKLMVGDPGNATSFTIARSKIHCGQGTLNTRRLVFGPFDVSDPGTFEDLSRDVTRHGGFKFKSKTQLHGSESGGRWSGGYWRKTKVFRHARKVDTCLIDVTWTAG